MYSGSVQMTTSVLHSAGHLMANEAEDALMKHGGGVVREREMLGYQSWEAAAADANDRPLWRKLIGCPTLHSRSSRN